MMNDGVRYYCEWLVLMRQEPIFDEDEHGLTVVRKSREEIQTELLKRLRRLQQAHSHSGDAGTDEELLSLMRQLYEQIVPSSVGKNGDAQMLSRKFLSPLTDPNAVGGLGIAKSGRKPRWFLKKQAGDPTWEEDYKRAIQRKQEDPTPTLLLELRRFGLHPLLEPFTDTVQDVNWTPKRKGQFVRTWDRDMFQQAIERMLSWESWNRRVQERFEQLARDAEKFYQENFASDDAFLSLAERLEDELKRSSHGFIAVAEGAFQIRPRSVRGFGRVVEEWLKLPEDAPVSEYEAVIKAVQARSGRDFGSYELFTKLARPEYRPLWRDDPTKLIRYARLRALQRKVAGAKQYARLTLPDAVYHPIWIRYDAEGGNIHDYAIRTPIGGDRRYFVTFSSLIMPNDHGGWDEHRDVHVPIAFSSQWERLRFVEDNAELCVVYVEPGAGSPLPAELGGAKIQFDRRHLQRRPNMLSAGGCGPVYLNVSVDVQPQVRPDVQAVQLTKVVSVGRETDRIFLRPENLVNYLKSSCRGENNSASPTLRVMAVDLGIRSSAAVVVCRVDPHAAARRHEG
ncbi:hypothetical protein GCM10010885_12790 [Alicyclobacillus cellulosilyticus]|uniref:Uncharacterized protein n=1 Tax=Alicyclobacillus cellulosilyticus TaxID=1003997 RepID=A0A917K9D6_9BACL|nr:hypothetical protein GCM10010885_12790 [Alicyclobacillus cellulosilyticus]